MMMMMMKVFRISEPLVTLPLNWYPLCRSQVAGRWAVSWLWTERRDHDVSCNEACLDVCRWRELILPEAASAFCGTAGTGTKSLGLGLNFRHGLPQSFTRHSPLLFRSSILSHLILHLILYTAYIVLAGTSRDLFLGCGIKMRFPYSRSPIPASTYT